MTDFYTTCETDHTTFGGMIYASDFDTEKWDSRNIAHRIAADLKFDERCRRFAEFRDKQKNYKKGN